MNEHKTSIQGGSEPDRETRIGFGPSCTAVTLVACGDRSPMGNARLSAEVNRQADGFEIVRASITTGSRPTATITIDGSAASARRSSRARL